MGKVGARWRREGVEVGGEGVGWVWWGEWRVVPVPKSAFKIIEVLAVRHTPNSSVEY